MSYEEYTTYNKVLRWIMCSGDPQYGIEVTGEIQKYFLQDLEIENLFDDSLEASIFWCPPVFDLHVRHLLRIYRRFDQTFIMYLRSYYDDSPLIGSKLLESQNRTCWIQYMPDLSRGIITTEWRQCCLGLRTLKDLCLKNDLGRGSCTIPQTESPIVLFSYDGSMQIGSTNVLHWIEIQENNPNIHTPDIRPQDPSFASRTPYPHTHVTLCSLCGLVLQTSTNTNESIPLGIESEQFLPENIAVAIREYLEAVTKRSMENASQKHDKEYIQANYRFPPTPFENYRLIAHLQLSRLRIFST